MKKVSSLIFFAVCVVMLLNPPSANAGTFFGKVCFGIFTDVLILNIETVGDNTFKTLTVTGLNTSQNRGMAGGGVKIGNTVKLFIGETAFDSPNYLGQLYSIVIDLTTPDWEGTADIILHKADGTHLLLQGITISTVPCP